MAMWCEILCFQYHPCGLRKLSLSTQGNCFSERRAECMGALCSQRWKKVQHHKSGLIWKKALSLCVSGFLTILLWEKCVNPKEQETDSCFLVPLIPVIYFKDIFRPSYLIFFAAFSFFPPPHPDAVNVLFHEQHSFCLWENRRGLYSSILGLVVLEALLMLGSFCLTSRVASEDMQRVHLLQHWS